MRDNKVLIIQYVFIEKNNEFLCDLNYARNALFKAKHCCLHTIVFSLYGIKLQKTVGNMGANL